MKKAGLMFGGLFLAAGLIVALIGGRSVRAQQDAVKRTVLFKTEVEGLPGKDVNLVVVEIAPGVESGKHYHSGDEIVYVVSGSGTDLEGKKNASFKSGSVVHLKPKQVHNVKSTGKTPLKALVLGIYAKNEPVTTPVK